MKLSLSIFAIFAFLLCCYSGFQVIYAPFYRNKQLKEFGLDQSPGLEAERRINTSYFLKLSLGSAVAFAICIRLISALY